MYEFRRRFDPQNLHAALCSYSLLWQIAAYLCTQQHIRCRWSACRAHAEHRAKRRGHLAKHRGKLERSATRAAPPVKSSCSAALSGKVAQRHTVPAIKFGLRREAADKREKRRPAAYLRTYLSRRITQRVAKLCHTSCTPTSPSAAVLHCKIALQLWCLWGRNKQLRTSLMFFGSVLSKACP